MRSSSHNRRTPNQVEGVADISTHDPWLGHTSTQVAGLSSPDAEEFIRSRYELLGMDGKALGASSISKSSMRPARPRCTWKISFVL